MGELVFKDLLEPLVMLVSLEKWVLRVSKDCQGLKDQEVPREMVVQLERMEFQEMLVRLVILVFLASLVCLVQLDLLELVVLMGPREMLDLLAHKDSRVFQVPRDPLVNLVRRELVEPQESLVQLDALGLLVNVVILEREDLLESKDLKALLDLLEHRVQKVLLVSLEIREKLERLERKDCKVFLD